MIGVVSDDYPATAVLHVIQMQTQHFAGSKTAARNAEARSLKASALQVRIAKQHQRTRLLVWPGLARSVKGRAGQ